MATLRVEIVSPEAALWAGEAVSLIAKSSEGDFTILPQHTPTVGDVVPSVVRVRTSEGELAFAVHGGYFQVGADGDDSTLATILAGVAERTSDIDVARAQAAKDKAEAQLVELSRGDSHADADRASVEASLARAELRLQAATK